MGIRVFICSAILSVVAAATSLAQNQPPAAQPQTVHTNGLEPIEITLRGSDPEGKDLKFEIVELPRYGELTEPQPIVPPEETDPRTGDPYRPPITSALVRYTPFELQPDSFTFSVTDEEGASGIAIVTINPPTEEPPPPPPETVIAIDRTVEVYVDRTTTLTLAGDAPEGVSLTFTIASSPHSGVLGELVQGTEQPRRSANVDYTPERGFLGEDAFEFKTCDDRGTCDIGVMTINVVEPAANEPVALVADIKVKTFMDQPVSFPLADDHRAKEQSDRYVFTATVAGNVADADDDGKGDNRNPLPGSEPLLMRAGVQLDDGEGATGTARMQLEWDLSTLREALAKGASIDRADVKLHAQRNAEEGVNTNFFWVAADNDGELTESDFQSDAEHIPGAVMPFGSLETFTFSVEGELNESLSLGFRVFAVQGRINEKQRERTAGLDVFTTAEDNLGREIAPQLVVETVRPPAPLEYAIKSLPDNGTLFDSLGNEIRDVPYNLPDAVVTFRPSEKFTGETRFVFQGSDGIRIDLATAVISVIRGSCADDPRFCNNGR